MLCHLIHEKNTGCSQDIPSGSGWKHCPRCGRPTGHLRAVEEAELKFSVPLKQQSNKQFFLRCTANGEAQVKVQAKLESSKARLLMAANASIFVFPRRPQTVQMQIDAVSQSGPLGYLLLEADDDAPDPLADPWKPRKMRKLASVPLQVSVDMPADPQVVQQCLIFRPGLAERPLVVVNRGSEDTYVTQVSAPAEYEVTPSSGELKGNERLEFKVRRVGKPAQASADLTLTFSGGAERKVTLVNIAQPATRAVPRAIFGIDFGTAFTSVSFRKCEYRKDISGKDVADKVELLTESGMPKTDSAQVNGGSKAKERFPTCIWIGLNGEVECGSKAKETYMMNPSGGYLFREIKTLLRDPDAVFVHPAFLENGEPSLPTAAAAMKRMFGDSWPQKVVTKYLEWLYRKIIQRELTRHFDAPVKAQYVFSLPVLDYATVEQKLYRQQLARMKQCIAEADFPMESVEFQFEPVCASLGLLHPRDASWPRLGGSQHPIMAGETIAVFDSGGGTTDVVLARADFQGQAGELSLQVERCLGVGSKVETFGGEMITTQIQQALRDPATVPGKSDWYDGSVNEDVILGIENDFPEGDLALDSGAVATNTLFDLERRDKTEQLKMDIATNGMVTRVSGTGQKTTLTSKLLEKLVLPSLLSLATELNSKVFTNEIGEEMNGTRSRNLSRENTRYYICMGGNTYIPTVEQWVSLFMKDDAPDINKRRLRIPGEERKIAVAYGAAWVPDARIPNAVLYDMEVRMGSDVLLELKRNTSQETYNRPYPILLEESGSQEIQVLHPGSGSTCVLESGIIQNPYGVEALVDIWTDVQNGLLRVQYQLSARSPLRPGEDMPPADPRKTLLTYAL